MKDQLQILWKAVGKAIVRKVNSYQSGQISKLFSVRICNNVIMDYLEATDIEKIPPDCAE